MTTHIQQYRTNQEFIDKLDSLRSAFRSLLCDVAVQSPPVKIEANKGIDFYENVQRFEIQLIELALEVAGGRQNRAARLLNLRESTLCMKMKQLKIKRAPAAF